MFECIAFDRNLVSEFGFNLFLRSRYWSRPRLLSKVRTKDKIYVFVCRLFLAMSPSL